MEIFSPIHLICSVPSGAVKPVIEYLHKGNYKLLAVTGVRESPVLFSFSEDFSSASQRLDFEREKKKGVPIIYTSFYASKMKLDKTGLSCGHVLNLFLFLL